MAPDWKRGLRPLAAVAALIALVLGYGFLRIHQVDARRAAAPKAKVGLVQANVGILEKWDPREFAHLIETHQRLSADLARAGADLIVWPESSYSYTLSRELRAGLPARRSAPHPARLRQAAAVRRASRARPDRRARSRTSSPTTPR